MVGLLLRTKRATKSAEWLQSYQRFRGEDFTRNLAVHAELCVSQRKPSGRICYHTCAWHQACNRCVLSSHVSSTGCLPQTPKSPIPRHGGGNSRSRPNRDSRIPGSRQTGIPDFPNPGTDQTGIQIRENPVFFAATRTVIAHCQRQARRLLQFVFGVPG